MIYVCWEGGGMLTVNFIMWLKSRLGEIGFQVFMGINHGSKELGVNGERVNHMKYVHQLI